MALVVGRYEVSLSRDMASSAKQTFISPYNKGVKFSNTIQLSPF
jgi:hypothetical protein